MMMTFVKSLCAMGVLCGTAVLLLATGCENYTVSSDTKTETIAAEPVITTNAADPASIVATPTNTVSTVLNDDPNCWLVVKYQNRDISNEGQVHYVKRVLTSDPFKSANPICVQYNDTRTGEVTVWKDRSSRGQRVDRLPSDRGIDKIVVWYE